MFEQYFKKKKLINAPVLFPNEPQPLRTDNYNETMRLANEPQIRTLSDMGEGVFPEPQPAPVEIVAPVAPFPTIREEEPVSPPAVFPVAPSQETQSRINDIYAKDYSKARYEDGNLIKPAGANRDKKWSTLEKIGNAAMGALLGAGRGGLGGAIVGGVRGATDRNFNEKLADTNELGQLYPRLNQQQQAEAVQRQAQMQQAQIQAIPRKIELDELELDEKRADRLRKTDDRVSREQTARMNQVASIFKNIPEFIPGDPRYADVEKALGDVNLPITPKDAKKKVDLKQDQRTGEWTVILTNPLDGRQEVRPVMKNGQVYKSTPTVVMQGEYGLLRQNDQQDFNAQQNQLNREQQERLLTIRQNFEREKADWQRADDAVKAARTQAEREAAEGRREASRKRIEDYQKQLQREFYDYKRENQ